MPSQRSAPCGTHPPVERLGRGTYASDIRGLIRGALRETVPFPGEVHTRVESRLETLHSERHRPHNFELLLGVVPIIPGNEAFRSSRVILVRQPQGRQERLPAHVRDGRMEGWMDGG